MTGASVNYRCDAGCRKKNGREMAGTRNEKQKSYIRKGKVRCKFLRRSQESVSRVRCGDHCLVGIRVKGMKFLFVIGHRFTGTAGHPQSCGENHLHSGQRTTRFVQYYSRTEKIKNKLSVLRDTTGRKNISYLAACK